jgi:hypothetical protein
MRKLGLTLAALLMCLATVGCAPKEPAAPASSTTAEPAPEQSAEPTTPPAETPASKPEAGSTAK